MPSITFAGLATRQPATKPLIVFFRIFTSQTTAALTYRESPPGTPIEGYRRTTGADPIALPGTNAAGSEWLSFPMFASGRMSPPETQTDTPNVQSLSTPGDSTFYGALVDNNLGDAYLPPTPTSGGGAIDLPSLMMGEHQCIVAQIEYAGTPIPTGATPWTSDKLGQRNIAFSEIANPGQDASRVALHTFEIEVAPQPIDGRVAPDELLLEWRRPPPDGTEVAEQRSTAQGGHPLSLLLTARYLACYYQGDARAVLRSEQSSPDSQPGLRRGLSATGLFPTGISASTRCHRRRC